jgi:predicted SprT family Zn-dependent metalloprotease
MLEELEENLFIASAPRNGNLLCDLGWMESKENVRHQGSIYPHTAPIQDNFDIHSKRVEEIRGDGGICSCCTATKNSKSFLPTYMLSSDPDGTTTTPPINHGMNLPTRNCQSSGVGQYRSPEVIVIDSESDDDPYPALANDPRAKPSHRISKDSHTDSSSEAEWDGDLDYVYRIAGDRYEEKSGTDTELIERTKEIIILSDDDGDGFVQEPKPRRKAFTKRCIPQPLAEKPKPESKLAFRKRREDLSRQLLVTFDRTVFDSKLLVSARGCEGAVVALSWSNKLRTTAGLTRLKSIGNPFLTKSQPDSRIRTAVVELSTKVIDSEMRLRSTLLHELCHAAAWIIDGIAKPAHGPCFQRWAKHAMKSVPDVTVTTRHNYEIDFKYTWVCINYPDACQTIIQRHSRSVNPERHVCGHCKGRLQEVSK